jgi:hypothetical protein
MNKSKSNPVDKFEYLGKTKNDKGKTFKTIEVDISKMKAVRIDKKTIKLVKKVNN